MNFPFSERILDIAPTLSSSSGLAINVFKGRLVNNPTSKGGVELHIFGSYLSKNANNPNVYQVDLLIDSAQFRNVKTASSGPNCFATSRHVLCITSLLKLCGRRNPLTKSNVSAYSYLCRRCLKLYKFEEDFRYHTSICTNFPLKRAHQPRRAKNSRTFQQFRVNRFNGKMEPSYIRFSLGKCFATIRPLTSSFCDFETSSIPVHPDPRLDGTGQPKSALSEHLPFSFCLTHISHYSRFPLPTELETPRVLHIDRETTGEQSFYLNFLLTVRKDFLMLDQFLRDVLALDAGRPSFSEMSDDERNRHLTAKRCSLCGSRYATENARSYKPLRPTVHHSHILESGDDSTSISLCVPCNLNTQTEVCKRISKTVYTWNGANFDHNYILTAAVLYGGTKFPVTNPTTGETTAFRPLIKGVPRILLRDQSILTLEMKFSCLNSECPGCLDRSNRRKRSRRRVADRKLPPFCPFSRAVKFFDLVQLCPSSLDKAVQDLALASEKENIPLERTFKHTYAFARQNGLSRENCEKFVRTKLEMPFALFSSVKTMQSIVTPPPREVFVNELSNSGNQPISPQSYENFKWSWEVFNCSSLLDLETVYIQCDCLQSSDIADYVFRKLHSLVGLWPGFFVTISMYAVNSALFNCYDPRNTNEKLKLPFLSKEITEIFELAIRGGYATTNALYASVSQCMTPDVSQTSKINFMDACSLYSNILCYSSLPLDDYVIFDSTRNEGHFTFLSRKILDYDTHYFAMQKKYFNHIYFCVYEQDYDKASIYSTIDVSGFPQTRKVEPAELSSFQRKSFQRDGKSFPENTRLISSCDRQVVGEWLDNIFLSSLLLFGKIGKIVTIVRCKAFPLFREYIEKLNKARGEEPSKLVGSIYKALSNTLAGHVCVDSKPSFSLSSRLNCDFHLDFILYRQISSRYLSATPPANCHGRKKV